jgi:hypothetical protein
MSLPEADRPLLNRPGAQQRRQRLAQQLPYHDSDVAAGSNANRSKKEQQVHEEFIELIKQEVAIFFISEFHCLGSPKLNSISSNHLIIMAHILTKITHPWV